MGFRIRRRQDRALGMEAHVFGGRSGKLLRLFSSLRESEPLSDSTASQVGFVLAAFVWKYLPDFPDNARFLTSYERRLLVLRLPSNVARATDENFSKAEILSALRSPLLWSFTGIQLFSNLGAYGLSFWLPSIIASFGL